ncbi:hypothetical protein FB45DRAFT_898557 [Roridomyces roridus]|uniref:Uncharacterized protein n=1 Tax=Roridomyces roridus TaxID=1738132 RepID=A0AAD7CCR4_9AGAR|nr:hypothetical protein FB45DRAFT_898557 [Roridomyces roridus]
MAFCSPSCGWSRSALTSGVILARSGRPTRVLWSLRAICLPLQRATGAKPRPPAVYSAGRVRGMPSVIQREDWDPSQGSVKQGLQKHRTFARVPCQSVVRPLPIYPHFDRRQRGLGGTKAEARTPLPDCTFHRLCPSCPTVLRFSFPVTDPRWDLSPSLSSVMPIRGAFSTSPSVFLSLSGTAQRGAG